MLVSEKAGEAPAHAAKLNNFDTPKGLMRLTTAVQPYKNHTGDCKKFTVLGIREGS